MTAAVAVDVWMRPCDSVAGTRWTRWVPPSYLNLEYAPSPRTSKVYEPSEASIVSVWKGQSESDSLNRLVVTAGLDWRQVQILRAYRKYHHRVNASFPVEYKNDAFAAHPHIAAALIRLFERTPTLFDIVELEFRLAELLGARADVVMRGALKPRQKQAAH
jgi:hypothetical protein